MESTCMTKVLVAFHRYSRTTCMKKVDQEQGCKWHLSKVISQKS